MCIYLHHKQFENAPDTCKSTFFFFPIRFQNNLLCNELLMMEATNPTPISRDALAEGDALPAEQSQAPPAKHPDIPLTNNSDCDVPSWNATNTPIPAENASFNDSAYVSLGRSNTGQGAATMSPEEKHSPRRGKVLPGTGLTVFEKEIEEDKRKRFEEVMERICELLAGKKPKWTRKDPNPGVMTTRILVLGKSETDAAPYLVVLCSPKLCGKVRSFMSSKRVRELYQPEGLKTIVVDYPPRMTSAILDIDVCLNSVPTANQITFCGSPITLVDKSHRPSCIRKRKATFGGVIEATFEDGSSKQYGMTAGHAVENLLSTSGAESYEVDCSEDSDGEDVQRQDSVPAQQSASLKITDDWPQHSSFGVWGSFSSDYESLGSVLDNNNFPRVIAGRTPLSHDWALFEINSPKPNVLCNSESSEEKRPLKIASRPGFCDNLCDPVIMMGSSGLKRGRLSSLPGAILRGNSKSFVKTYMLELDGGNGM
jgi:hypothetical protein